MDYSPSRQEVQSNFSYHQGDVDARPAVQWTAQDNQQFQNATIQGKSGDVNVYANNVYIDTGNTNVYQPVQEVQTVQVQRVGFNNNSCYPNQVCRDRGLDAGAAIIGGIIGGVISGAILDRHGNRHHDRGWDRGGWDRGGWDRGGWDRGGWDNRGQRPYYPPPRHHYPIPQPSCPPYYGNGGYQRRCR